MGDSHARTLMSSYQDIYNQNLNIIHYSFAGCPFPSLLYGVSQKKCNYFSKLSTQKILANLKQGDSVLDVAGGTGDLSILMSDLVGESGEIILSDINEKMLKLGKARSLDKNKLNIKTTVADAENLPFPDNRFNCITIGFGIRNVTNKLEALKNFYRCLKPGGRLLVLEFSKPASPLISDLYDFYSFKILPKLGKIFAQDEESYQYLAESIRMHPSQEEFKQMLQSVNFKNVSYDIMTAGIVTLHIAEK